jgi:hypothetical protein
MDANTIVIAIILLIYNARDLRFTRRRTYAASRGATKNLWS